MNVSSGELKTEAVYLVSLRNLKKTKKTALFLENVILLNFKLQVSEFDVFKWFCIITFAIYLYTI